MTRHQLEEIGQGAVLLGIGVILLLLMYYFADFILSNSLVIVAVVLTACAVAIWRWSVSLHRHVDANQPRNRAGE